MSLDNVIAVAAASRGDTFLLVAGLLISIPLVVYGSTLLLKVVERYPLIVWGGAALLGYVAGDIAVHDPAIETWATAQAAAMGVSLANLGRLVGLLGAALVVGLAWMLLRRRKIAALARTARAAARAAGFARRTAPMHRRAGGVTRS
jgi:predicted tellurium resistance membrane protein TerC